MAVRISESVRRFHAVSVPGSREPQLWPTVKRFLDLGNPPTPQPLSPLSLSCPSSFSNTRYFSAALVSEMDSWHRIP